MNKKIKQTLLVGALATATFSATPLLANGLQVGEMDSAGRIQTQSTFKDGKMTTKVAHAEAKFNVALTEALRAVITLELASALNGTVDKDDLERILEEAYIEADSKYATIRFGKMTTELNKVFAKMAIPENDQLYSINRKEGVMAVQFELTPEALKIAKNAVDSMSVTIFENGSNDFEISEHKGVNVRASKALSDKLTAEVSALWAQHAGGTEKGATMSLAYQIDDGTVAWAKVQWMDNNPVYVGSNYGAVVGVSKKVGPGSIVLQASFVEAYGADLGASYVFQLTEVITLAPEVRYNTDSKQTTVAVAMTITGQKRFKFLSDLNGQ